VLHARRRAPASSTSAAQTCPELDYILTPADIGFVNDLPSRMNGVITAHAVENRYAISSLDALCATSRTGVAFDLQAFLMSPAPCGTPSASMASTPAPAGQGMLARAALTAVNLAYGSSLAAPL
jgi:hypothetical protein